MVFFRQNFQHNQSNQSGLSLIMVSVILTVIGLLMVAAVQMYTIGMQTERTARYKVSTSLASSAINKFFLMNGVYPRPANPGNALGTNNFGRSAPVPGGGWLDCQDAATPDGVVCSTTTNTATAGGAVLIGVLPYKDLNIPFSSVIDTNGNLLTYAVTRNLTTGTFDETAGQIIVLDNATNNIHPAGAMSHFAVVSHGDDRQGAYGQNGVRNIACSNDANSNDFENCNKDGTFRSNVTAGTTTVDIFDAAGGVHFDDYVVERNSTAAGLWAYISTGATDPLSINERMGGNVATGDCDGKVPCIPVSRLDVYGDGTGGVPSVRATAIWTKRICNRGNPANDAPDSAPFSCVGDYSLATNVATDEPHITTCIGTVCNVGATWSATNLPPWFTPELIVGDPPILDETSVYWQTDPTTNHGEFHRGNGIRCVGGRALNGIFDHDEACDTTSHFINIIRDRLTSHGGCGTGQYAIGYGPFLDQSLLCATP